MKKNWSPNEYVKRTLKRYYRSMGVDEYTNEKFSAKLILWFDACVKAAQTDNADEVAKFLRAASIRSRSAWKMLGDVEDTQDFAKAEILNDAWSELAWVMTESLIPRSLFDHPEYR